MITMMQDTLGLASGVLAGFSVGLVGGGGSVLAVPLMIYVVGVSSAHVAIGTSAIAVAVNAAINLRRHLRGGHVRWSSALVFAAAGIAGAISGSALGKLVDGDNLLVMFALLMLAIAGLMLGTRSDERAASVDIGIASTPALLALGLVIGTLAGVFGIGGGFLIVPALMLATGMAITGAIASSLVAVTAFGITTAASYAWSGLIAWPLALTFVLGGIVGRLAGTASARYLALRRSALDTVFASIIIVVALYMLAHNIYVT